MIWDSAEWFVSAAQLCPSFDPGSKEAEPHSPAVCALAMRALSCPAEQGVPAPTQTLHQPPLPVMSLTCQKLCQLKHKGETAPK